MSKLHLVYLLLLWSCPQVGPILVLSAGLRHVFPALLVAVQSAVLAAVTSANYAPQDGGAEVAVGRGCVVISLKPGNKA